MPRRSADIAEEVTLHAIKTGYRHVSHRDPFLPFAFSFHQGRLGGGLPERGSFFSWDAEGRRSPQGSLFHI